MTDKPKDVLCCPSGNDVLFLDVSSSISTLETPNLEEIARAIWQRQHDTLRSDAISYNAQWRDQSIPSKFWSEFLLDAHAVLLLLQKKQIEYRNIRECKRMMAGAPAPTVPKE